MNETVSVLCFVLLLTLSSALHMAANEFPTGAINIQAGNGKYLGVNSLEPLAPRPYNSDD